MGGTSRRACSRAARAAAALALAAAAAAQGADPVLHDFAQDLQGWAVPAWTRDRVSYVSRGVSHARRDAVGAAGSLALGVAFDGDRWQRALVASSRPLDLRGFRSLSFQVWLPADAPRGIAATVFVQLGDDGEGVESTEVFRLAPGGWTRVEVSLLPGQGGWRAPFERARVRGLMLAVEKYRGEPLAWQGEVGFDEVTLHRPR